MLAGTEPPYIWNAETGYIVKCFLREHQAMGIYLYGELALSPKAVLRRLGKEVLKSIIDEMDIDLASSAREMTFG